LSDLISASSSLVGPVRSLWSTWAWITHFPTSRAQPRAWAPEPGTQPRPRGLTESIKDHPDRSLTLLERVPLRHDMHPSQERKRHQTRDGSVPRHPATVRGLLPRRACHRFRWPEC
jgi:hypothetical protein